MSCSCPTCQCDHAGEFPRFTALYSDGAIYRGGGPEDTDQVIFSLPRSWVDLPPLGVIAMLSEDSVVGRRIHRGMELIYALAPQTRGGPDITPTGPETKIFPAMLGQYGIAKVGEHTTTAKYHAAMRLLLEDTHVPMQSATSPFELEQ